MISEIKNPEPEKVWEIFKHIDTIREGRTNFFLVAEAMLVTAYTTLPSADRFLRYTVSILALIYTGSWFLINMRQSNRLDFLVHNILLKDDIFMQIAKAGRGIPGKHIMNLLPVFTGLFWIILILKI